MRVLSAILLFVIPSLVFAQSPAGNQAFDSEIAVGDHADPFARYLFQADNPCNSRKYLELNSELPEKMSDREFAVFKQKTEDCQEFVNRIEVSKTARDTTVSNEDIIKKIKPHHVFLGASITVVSVILIFR